MTETFSGVVTSDGKKRSFLTYDTLTKSGVPADSKAVGDKFKEVKTETDSLKEDLADLENDIYQVVSEKNLLKVKKFELVNGDGYIFNTDGDYFSLSGSQSERATIKVYPDFDNLSAGNYYIKYPHGLNGDNVIGIQFNDINGNVLTNWTYSNSTDFSRISIEEDLTNIGYITLWLAYNNSPEINVSGYVWLVTSENGNAPYEPKYGKTFLTKEETEQLITEKCAEYNPLERLNGKKILTYGDSQTEMNRWQPIVANLTESEVISYGFGGYPLALATIKEGSDAFGLAMDYRINELITKIAETSPDILLIMGGNNDFSYDGVEHSNWNTITVGNNTDTSNTTFKGAVKYIARKVLEEYPTLLIVFMSPVDGFVEEAGINMTEPRTNGLGYSLGTFSKAMEEVTGYIGVPFIDVHRACITVYNSANYISDGVHMNDTIGAKRVANKVINGLLSILDFN